MKLAMLAPIAWRTPPEHYGPWESIASLLTEGLVARGVDVTLFATLDSVTTAALDGVCPHGYAEDAQLDGRVWEALHVSHALARSGEFELVHNHLDWLPLAFGEHARAPMVTTIHGFSGAGILPAYTRSRSAFVAISDSDRYAGLDYAATIHHGIDLGLLPYRAAGGDSLVSFGRIHPDKGTADAIEIARRAGRRLVICGIVQDERYFADAVEPHVDGDQVVFLGSMGCWSKPGPTSSRPRPPTGVTDRWPSRVSVRSRKSRRYRPRLRADSFGSASPATISASAIEALA